MVGGSAVAWLGSDRAAAAVSTSQISIPPTSVETPDGDIDSIQATVTGQYQFQVNNADTMAMELRVAPPDGEFGVIDSMEESVSTTSDAGGYTLSGSVLQHQNIGVDLFSVSPEETKTVTLPVRVWLGVSHDGSTVVEAIGEGAAEVEIESGEIVASATVMGDGEVAVEV